MRKLQRVGPNPDQKKLTQAYHSLSQDERRAYQEALEQQGGMVAGELEGVARVDQHGVGICDQGVPILGLHIASDPRTYLRT